MKNGNLSENQNENEMLALNFLPIKTEIINNLNTCSMFIHKTNNFDGNMQQRRFRDVL